MEESFTHKWYPELSGYAPELSEEDYIPDETGSFYAVAFDSKGSLGWQSNTIEDEDPGYDKARIIEVLTRQADPAYLGYLKEMKIPYIFAGETVTDIPLALEKLKKYFGIEVLLLEGGSDINGAFLRSESVDELSLVVCPLIAGADSKPLFAESEIETFKLTETEKTEDVLVLHYKR